MIKVYFSQFSIHQYRHFKNSSYFDKDETASEMLLAGLAGIDSLDNYLQIKPQYSGI